MSQMKPTRDPPVRPHGGLPLDEKKAGPPTWPAKRTGKPRTADLGPEDERKVTRESPDWNSMALRYKWQAGDDTLGPEGDSSPLGHPKDWKPIFEKEELAEDDGYPGDEDEDADDVGGIQVRPKFEITKVLPEDRMRRKWQVDHQEMYDGFLELDAANSELPETFPGGGTVDFVWWKEQWKLAKARVEFLKNPYLALSNMRIVDKEAFATASVADAMVKASARNEKVRNKERISDPVGTGAESGNVYVEIRPRLGEEDGGPASEAVNIVVSEALGIPVEKANKLIELGSVWVYDEYWGQGWERIMKQQTIESEKVLRVFPNPERFKMCYVEDWRDRIKCVDPDFVAVDKPPLLPCFAKVSNGRESLSQCVREALHVRKWGGDFNRITEDMRPCHEIDEEASGLIVIARHEAASEAFDYWVEKRMVHFEFVALVTGKIEKGVYRHYFQATQKRPGAPKPALFEEIPRHLIKHSEDYASWDMAEMEVVATADLPGGAQAIRIRTHGTGLRERIRAQLAMLGVPVLNDSAATRGTPVSAEAARSAGLIPEGLGGSGRLAASSIARSSPLPLGGAVDDATWRGPYGRKLQLQPAAREAAERGVPQTPRKKVPVALHLARIEYGGRVVTCGPPAYWPEGAAAAVAMQLTTKDMKESIFAFIATHGGTCRFAEVGGRFGVKVDWLEEHFSVDRARGLVFSSSTAQDEWQARVRVKDGVKAWEADRKPVKRKAFKDKIAGIREKYIAPKDMNKAPTPTYKTLKKNLVKPVRS